MTNAAPAIPGQPVESDSLLRARQSLSVALPSMTMLAGTIAAIAATPGVTRYNILENPTGSTDSYGNPPHSITCVVENGSNAAIAQAIYNNHGIGCYTNGTTAQTVTDSYTGQTYTVNFSRPTYVPVYVSLSVHALAGYTTATTTAIQTAITNYLNSLQIGQKRGLKRALRRCFNRPAKSRRAHVLNSGSHARNLCQPNRHERLNDRFQLRGARHRGQRCDHPGITKWQTPPILA